MTALKLDDLNNIGKSKSKSKSKSKCYPSSRLDGVNRYTASGPHVAPHQPVNNHHTTVCLSRKRQ